MTLIEEVLASMVSNYSNEGRVTNADIVMPADSSSVATPYIPSWDEVASGVYKAKDAKGQSMYTNVLDASGTPTMIAPQKPPIVSSGATSNLDSLLKSFDGVTDIKKRETLLADLSSNLSRFEADSMNKAKTQIETNLGVAEVQRQLQASMLLDRQHPSWSKNQSDSTETLAIRNTLTNLQARTSSLIPQVLAGDAEYAAKVAAAKDVYTRESKQLDQDYKLRMMNLEKSSMQNEAAADILAGMNQESLNIVASTFPSLKNQDGTIDNTKMAKFLETHNNGKEWKPLVDGTVPASEYFRTALNGNKAAEIMAVAAQSKATGKNLIEVKSELDYAKRLMNEPALLKSEMKKYRIAIPQEANQQDAKSMLNVKKSKEELLQDRQIAIGNVEKVLSAMNAAKLDDLSTWKAESNPIINDPNAAKIYDEMKVSLARKPSLMEFAATYINDPTLDADARKARKDLLTSNLKSNAKQMQGSLFYPALTDGDIDNKMRVLEVTAARSSGKSMIQSYSKFREMIPTIATVNYLEEKVKENQPYVSDFFKGMWENG